MPFTTRPALTSRQAMMRLARVSKCTEVLQDLQSYVPRLLGMKLDAEQVAPFRRRGEGLLVGAGRDRISTQRRTVRVGEVHVGARRDSRQQTRGAGHGQAVPAHMGRLGAVGETR